MYNYITINFFLFKQTEVLLCLKIGLLSFLMLFENVKRKKLLQEMRVFFMTWLIKVALILSSLSKECCVHGTQAVQAQRDSTPGKT